MAVIFVSNCKSSNNNRLGFLKELQKYMPVDVFGKCGKIVACGVSKLPDRKCMSDIIKEYKFYLSFENANCRDYITEKVFINALSNGVVPVVLGAHPNDYKRALPPHSYIHVEDFDSAEQLATYLRILYANNGLYKHYFDWKFTGTFDNIGSPGYLFCRSCGMLYYSEFVSHPDWTESEYTAWKNSTVCLEKNRWYWGRE